MRHSHSMTSEHCLQGSLNSSRTLLIGVLLSLCLTSCAPRGLEIKTAPVELEQPTTIPILPNPIPIKALPFSWLVVTNSGNPQYCLSPKGYENLARTQADIIRWVNEAHWRLNYYRGETGDGQQ